MEVTFCPLSQTEMQGIIETLREDVNWRKQDNLLRESGHDPIVGKFTGQNIQNKNNYTSISQEYGDNVALISVLVDGKPIGSASFYKIEATDAQQISDLNNFWQRLLNALLESSACLPVCSLKAVQCAQTVNWSSVWFIVAKDLVSCVLSQEDCRDCLVDAFKKAFSS